LSFEEYDWIIKRSSVGNKNKYSKYIFNYIDLFRLSFPSLHASLSMYSAVFLAVCLKEKKKKSFLLFIFDK